MYRFALIACCTIVAAVSAVVAGAAEERGNTPNPPPEGPFGYTLLQTADGAEADIDMFLSNESCGVCHERQLREVQGSMHSAAHTDPLYRRLAEIARQEAGTKTYRYCSGCHSAAGVVSGLIPAKHDADLPPEAKAGVSCDVCHQIGRLTGSEGPWREPGNASLVIEQGLVKFGPSGQVAENRLHTGRKRDFFTKAEFCASCHTVIHPINGLRIENTYEEWKSSVYAERGIQCQDCHMRSVDDALKVARTLRPVVVEGASVTDGRIRPIFPHFFVGGNANADRLAHGSRHAAMAEKRLKSAARLELAAPAEATAGKPLRFDVIVHNVAAGHNIPTGVTELRQMWIALRILDEEGKVVFRDDGLTPNGELRPGVIWFGAVAGDRLGKATYKPWEMSRFLRKSTVPPKGFLRHTASLKLPAGLSGTIYVEARLLYRSAPPSVVAAVMKGEAFKLKAVEMSRARVSLSVR